MSQQPIFESPIMQQLLRMVDRIAKAKGSVLLIGETGTGKEVIADTIHQRSQRADNPLIELNCGAIPDHLVESELFGAEKGAFTGADQSKPGFFELANGGTLFLDEIGDLNLSAQSKLLRVLDGAPYFRLGGNRKIDADVRVIAATNRDLAQAVEEGSFRRDLFHRLAQFQINVPPLRSRPEDVVPLAESWLAAHKQNARFTAAALRALAAYDWPGNVRELKNVVLRSAMMTDGDVIDVEDLEITAKSPVDVMAPSAAVSSSFEPGRTLESIERNAIFAALAGCGGNQGKAAHKLGISRRTLVRKLKQYRTTEAQPIGYMSREQQKYFRARFETVVFISHNGAEYAGKLRNVSGSGLSVRELSMALPTESKVIVGFKLADESELTLPARIVWARPSGEAGLAWVERIPRALSAWLLRQQAGEGWSVAPPDSEALSYAAHSSR